MLSDRVAVFNHGRIVQVGTPGEIYERPMHRVRRPLRRRVQRVRRCAPAGGQRAAPRQRDGDPRGRAAAEPRCEPAGGTTRTGTHPANGSAAAVGGNALRGTVASERFLGDHRLLSLDVAGLDTPLLVSEVADRAAASQVGAEVTVTWAVEDTVSACPRHGSGGRGIRMMQILHRATPTATAARADTDDVWSLHRALTGYAPSPLATPEVLRMGWDAELVGVKLETRRWGLPSFKVVGTMWAFVEALRNHLPPDWRVEAGLEALRGRLPALEFVAASEGNHGEAVAFVARQAGQRCRIFVSDDVADPVVDRIHAQGGLTTRVPGSYDDAVRASAAAAKHDGVVLLSDTSWPGYEDIPRAVARGYSTILREASDQLAELGHSAPDLVVVPIGVGALASAVVDHFVVVGDGRVPAVVGVEPSSAACVMTSLAADRILTLPGPLRSDLSGLNCGTPSLVAWPALRRGLSAVVAVDSDAASSGRAVTRRAGLSVGPCAEAVLAVTDWLLAGPDSAAHRTTLHLPDAPVVLLLATDGPAAADGHDTKKVNA